MLWAKKKCQKNLAKKQKTGETLGLGRRVAAVTTTE